MAAGATDAANYKFVDDVRIAVAAETEAVVKQVAGRNPSSVGSAPVATEVYHPFGDEKGRREALEVEDGSGLCELSRRPR